MDNSKKSKIDTSTQGCDANELSVIIMQMMAYLQFVDPTDETIELVFRKEIGNENLEKVALHTGRSVNNLCKMILKEQRNKGLVGNMKIF